jgi:hypothetical protein
MRKTALVVLAIALCAGVASAQRPATMLHCNEQGSILVYPLIDNSGDRITIIDFANRGDGDVWVQGFMIVRAVDALGVRGKDFIKKDFYIHATAKEPVYWNTSKAYNRTDPDGVLSQVQAFDNYEGFCFLWAIDNQINKREIDWDFLKGDAIVLEGPRAYQYNAIAHQGMAVIGDRILCLDGIEYLMAPSQIMVEGFAEDFVRGLGGTLVVCSLDIDFIRSRQPAFDINFEVWNQNEVPQSRHLDFCQFQQYDLTKDLQLSIYEVFTPKWQMATSSTDAMYAVFFQYLPGFSPGIAWGGNPFQHPFFGAVASVILPPVPGLQ